jgi:electron transfer flavoprotein beta subunit
MAALNAKILYNAEVSVGTMGPPIAEQALQQSQLICDADELHLYSDRIFAGADTLATAEVLRAGLDKMHDGAKSDIVFSGHRASDGETGQTGPQTAWKLGYTFFGNVIAFSVDLERRLARVTRLVPIQGLHDVIEELEAPLPIFITIHPSYKPVFTTVSQRLTFFKCQKEARDRSALYKDYLKTFTAQTLGVDPKLVGLPGSPTIVYRVEKIPRAKTSRMAEIVDGSNRDQIKAVAKKMTDMIKVK